MHKGLERDEFWCFDELHDAILDVCRKLPRIPTDFKGVFSYHSDDFMHCVVDGLNLV